MSADVKYTLRLVNKNSARTPKKGRNAPMETVKIMFPRATAECSSTDSLPRKKVTKEIGVNVKNRFVHYRHDGVTLHCFYHSFSGKISISGCFFMSALISSSSMNVTTANAHCFFSGMFLTTCLYYITVAR